MKKGFLLTLLVTFVTILTSCSDSREKLVKDYHTNRQTESLGMSVEFNQEIEFLNESTPITILDSLTIKIDEISAVLKKDVNEENIINIIDERISVLKNSIKTNEKMADEARDLMLSFIKLGDSYSEFKSERLMKSSLEEVKRLKSGIESLNQYKNEITNFLNRDKNEVLAYTFDAKITTIIPMSDTKVKVNNTYITNKEQTEILNAFTKGDGLLTALKNL